MESHIHIKITVGFQDYLAIAIAIISFIIVSFFYPVNFYLSILYITLFLSIFLEKEVQILLILNSLVFLFTYQFLPLIVSNISLLDVFSLNFSKLTDNPFIVFLGSVSFSAILLISIISNLNLVLKTKYQQYIDYINTFSSAGFIIIAFALSLVLIQDSSSFIVSLMPITVNFSFLITIYLHFTLIINLFYIFFILIFLSFLLIRKVQVILTPSQKQAKKVRVKKKHTKRGLESKKTRNRKVRGV